MFTKSVEFVKPERPQAVPVNLDTIPARLKQANRWVVWKYVEDVDRETGEVSFDKPPRCARTGGLASSTNPKSWAPFKEAAAAYERGGLDGVGFVLAPSPGDDLRLVAVDLDKCRDPDTGAVEPWAAEIVQALDSYTEVSPSGLGLRLFLLGRLPPKGRKKGKYENYESGRYVTVTGAHVPGTPESIEARQEQLLAVHKGIFGDLEREEKAAPRAVQTPTDLNDQELIQEACKAKNGHKFKRLWEGDRSGYGSASEADLALCNHLAFWCQGDRGRMASLYEQSGLFRSKWKRDDYRERTIDMALKGRTEFYKPRGARQPSTNGARHANGDGRVVGSVDDEPPPEDHGDNWQSCCDEPSAPAPVRLATTSLADIRPEPIHWLVPKYVPLGKLILLAGDGGHGKSTVTLSMTADLTQGRPCLGLQYDPLPPCDVLLIGCEDDYADTVVPRLLAADANRQRVFRVDGVRGQDGKVLPFSLAHYEAMERELEARPNIRLVVIDPAGAYIGRAGVNDHKDSELRSLLDPMAELAARRRVTIILVKHLNKGASPKAIHKVSGSTGYVNAVRAAYVVAPSQEEESVKLLLPLKFNIGPKPDGLSYSLNQLALKDCDQLLEPFAHLQCEDRARLAEQLFRVRWLGQVSTDADSLFAAAAREAKAGPKVKACAEWLTKFLATYAYPSDEIVEAAEREDFTFDNVKVAKGRLKEKGLRNSNRTTFQGNWWSGFGDPKDWKLRPEPPASHHSHDTPQSPHNGTWGEIPSPHIMHN